MKSNSKLGRLASLLTIIIFHEKITALAAVETVLTLAGLFLSGSKLFLRKEEKQNGLAK